MKLNKADTQLGVQFNVVEFEASDILSLIQDPTKLAAIVAAVNADRRQKIALVDARYDLSAKIATSYGFARKTKDVIVDGQTTQVPDETESKHIKRFTDALVDGSHTAEGWTVPSGDATVKENVATAFLQSIANTCGDKEHDGAKCYILNLDKTIRKGGTGLIPKWAMEAATTIITNKNTGTWVERFTNGYTTNRGIVIDAFVFAPFEQKAAKGSTPEGKEVVHQSNIKNLAKAINEVRRQENEKSQPDFA
jgi:hypothetical protein